MRQWKHRPLRTSLLIGLATFALVCGLWRLGWFQSAELWIYDHEVAWRAGPGGADDPRIVLVSLGEKDIRKYDYPLRDKVLAQLLTRIERDGPRAIGLDLYRDLPEPRNGSELASLSQVLTQYSNIVCIFRFGTETQPFLIKPPKVLIDSTDQIGFNDFADSNTIRRGLIYLPNSFAYRSLAWQMARLYLAPMGLGEGPGKDGAVALGKTSFPRFRGNDGGYVNAEAGGYQFLLDYKGPRQFRTFSVDEALTAAPANAFHDKVVLIGTGGASLNDVRSTPPSPLETGVVIHAKIVNQFLRAALNGDQSTVSWGLSAETAWILGWCALATALGYFCRSTWSFGLALLGTLIAQVAFAWLAFLHGLWLLAAAPGAAILLAAGAVKAYMAQSEATQRSVLMGLFSQHVSSDVANVIWERRDEFLEGNRPRAQKLTATILFLDLKSYSTLSEKLEPDVLIEWVNECLGGLGHHVAENGGMIDKFMGDAIMAVFGAPVARTTQAAIREDAIHAVKCALDMKKEMERLNADWKSRGLPEAGMRVGIYTGMVMGCLVGNVKRLEYTLIGDTTNTAARLESVRVEGAPPDNEMCRILVGDSTFELIKDCFSTELVAKVNLKGQSKTTVVYRILGSI